MQTATCPCKGCTTETGRCAECHASCMKYAKWKNEWEGERERINELHALEFLANRDRSLRIDHTIRLIHSHHLHR